MLKNKGVIGVVGGLVLALVGPVGVAIGHFAHPVGEASHPDAGAVFGTVTDSQTGDPLEGVCVEISPRGWYGYGSYGRGVPRYAYRHTDQDGHYFSTDLRAGNYMIQFDPDCSSSQVRNEYATEWADDAARAIDARNVRVRTDQTSIADAELDPAGTISGSVVDALGDSPSTCVTAYLSDTDRFDVRWPDVVSQRYGEVVGRSRVHNGTYRIRGLGPGEYRVLAGCLRNDYGDEAPAPFGYIPAWISTVTLPVGDDVAAGQAVLPLAGSVAGTVRDQFGRPRTDVCVDAWKSTSRPVGGSYSDTSSYDGPRLPEGTFRLSVNQYWCSSNSWWFGPEVFYSIASHSNSVRFERTWFQDSPNFGGADEVTVTPGTSTPANFVVRLLGSDLNVVDLEVSDPVVKTALAEAPGAGLRKEIRVTVREDGILRPSYWYNSSPQLTTSARIIVWAESRAKNQAGKDVIHFEDFDLSEGASKSISLSWTPRKSVGDIEIHARACVLGSPSSSADVLSTNNELSEETYVGVGGLGGASLDSLAPWDNSPFGYYC